MNRKLKIFIAVSTILNVVLIGVIAGHSYHRYGVERGDQIIALLEKSSIPEEKRQFIKIKLENNPHNGKAWEGRKKWRDETMAILTAEKFDANAYRSQLEEMAMRQGDNKKQKVEALIELASELNHKERMALAEIFRKSRK